MSGIVAVLDRGGPGLPTGVLRDATERLAVHGPDGTGHWSAGGVSLGHQLFAATPEADQVGHPVVRGDLAVTADVRLDNRPELLDALGVDAGLADSELLLAAYDRWGTDCVERLVGAFAFALWDADRQRLFCARDHLGVRPLYCHESAGRVAVATSASALLALPDVGATPDEHRIGDYLAGRFADRQRSFYADVARLRPAHALEATADAVRRREYWSLADVEPLPARSRSYYDRRFRELFERAVADRLRGPDRVGSLLSGGLDSSSIACVAGRLREQRNQAPIPTFSAVFEEMPACDESGYVDAVLGSGSFEPHRIHGDQIPPLGALPAVLDGRGEPYYPSLFTLPPALYERAAAEGVSVVLQGYGGDQTMGSDPRGYLRGLAQRGRLPSLAGELRAYRRRRPWVGWRDALWRDVVAPLVPEPLRRLRHARFDEDHYVETVFASVDPAFARQSGLAERLGRDAVSAPPRSQRAMRRDSLTADEPPFNLEVNHAAGAAAGVEPRYPYFDRRLVEFAVALPPGTTVDDGLDRTIVRRALSGDLPRTVRERDDKTEFSSNVRHGVRSFEMDGIEATLFEGSPAAETYLDVSDLRAAFDRLRSGDGSATDARNLLMATTLERWLRERP